MGNPNWLYSCLCMTWHCTPCTSLPLQHSGLSCPPSDCHWVGEIDVKGSGNLEIPFPTVMTTLGILSQRRKWWLMEFGQCAQNQLKVAVILNTTVSLRRCRITWLANLWGHPLESLYPGLAQVRRLDPSMDRIIPRPGDPRTNQKEKVS